LQFDWLFGYRPRTRNDPCAGTITARPAATTDGLGVATAEDVVGVVALETRVEVEPLSVVHAADESTTARMSKRRRATPVPCTTRGAVTTADQSSPGSGRSIDS
jgi:hypothetical protein